MCYRVLLSTSTADDLSARSTDLVRFEKKYLDDEIASTLAYDHRWYSGSKSGCSCTFRRATTAQLGFGRPVDWYPENDDELEATAAFIAVVRRVLESGHLIDCIDVWDDAGVSGILQMEVDLNEVADEEFRFFENYHFTFVRRVRDKQPGAMPPS